MCYQSCCCCSESDLSHRMKENKAWKRSSLSMLPLAAVMCSTTAIVTHLNQWPLSSRSRQSSSMRNSGEKEPDKKLNQQFFFCFFFPPICTVKNRSSLPAAHSIHYDHPAVVPVMALLEPQLPCLYMCGHRLVHIRPETQERNGVGLTFWAWMGKMCSML